MADIQTITVAQSQSVSVSRSQSLSNQRDIRAAELFASAEQLGNASSDAANQVLDVIDISDDARQQLLQDQADAELLASIATSERPQVLTAPLILRNGRIEVDAIAAQIAQQFTFEESFELDFLQETSVTIETDEGSVEFTQSTALEVDFSSSISIEQNAETGSFQIAFDA